MDVVTGVVLVVVILTVYLVIKNIFDMRRERKERKHECRLRQLEYRHEETKQINDVDLESSDDFRPDIQNIDSDSDREKVVYDEKWK